MSIVKTITQDMAAAGDVVTVTLVVNNVGSSTAFTPMLTDTLPVSMTFDGGLVTESGLTPTSLSQSGGANIRDVTVRGNRLHNHPLPRQTHPWCQTGPDCDQQGDSDQATTLPGVDPGERTDQG